ncbi:hypothetical protein Tco_0756262 [Tanacetum coccineum]
MCYRFWCEVVYQLLHFGVIRFEAFLEENVGSPILWAEIRESSLIGLQLVQETTDKVVIIKEKLQAIRDRQKSYADNRRKPLEFEVGDEFCSNCVIKGVALGKCDFVWKERQFCHRGMLGPFEIIERIGPVAYRLRLPEELSEVHDTFHVSNLKKCLADASLNVSLDEIKRSRILLVKVRWNSKRDIEFTWEREDYMKSKYPQLFVDRADESAS